ncbi:LysR family transcriptional regulator [Bacillus tianshenii]|nr:LysR family transcriptional regulator [Bacillus tianshenii]
MELRQIKYFIEVAEREHVTDAANALHVAQSAVSRQIVNLEAELDVSLFIREGRNVKLTPIGKAFLSHMKEAMHVIENALREVEEYSEPERGTIRIGYPSSLAAYLLPIAISAFREKYPLVKFHLHQSSYHELIKNVINGEIDLALLGPIPKHENKVEGNILFLENMIALVPVNHPAASQDSVTLSELQNDPFILFPDGYILREVVVKACQESGYEPNVAFEGEDIDAIKGLVAAGLGVTLIPEITIIDTLPRATVKLPLRDKPVTRTVGVIIPNNRQLLPTVKLFYDFVKDHFRKLAQFH